LGASFTPNAVIAGYSAEAPVKRRGVKYKLCGYNSSDTWVFYVNQGK